MKNKVKIVLPPPRKTPAMLIHPFKENGSKGISMEGQDYTVGEIDDCSSDPARQLLFELAVAMDGKGGVWVRQFSGLEEDTCWWQIADGMFYCEA